MRVEKRCVAASFPERHKYIASYPTDFCHPLKPNLMQSNNVRPMQLKRATVFAVTTPLSVVSVGYHRLPTSHFSIIH